MNWLTNLFHSLFGGGQPAGQAPVSTPVKVATPPPQPNVQVQAPAQPQQSVSVAPPQTPDPSQLVKIQGLSSPAPVQAPAASPTVSMAPGTPAYQQPATPQPNLLQKVGSYLGNEASFAVQHPVTAVRTLGENMLVKPAENALGTEHAYSEAAPLTSEQTAAATNESQNVLKNQILGVAQLIPAGKALEGGEMASKILGSGVTGGVANASNAASQQGATPGSIAGAGAIGFGGGLALGTAGAGLGKVFEGIRAPGADIVPDSGEKAPTVVPTASDIKTATNKALEIVPGVTSTNPDYIAGVRQNVVDTLTPKPDTNTGTMTDIRKPVAPGEPVSTPVQTPVAPNVDGITASQLQKAPAAAEAPLPAPEPVAPQQTPGVSPSAPKVDLNPAEPVQAPVEAPKTAPETPVSMENPQNPPLNAENTPVTPPPPDNVIRDINGEPMPAAMTAEEAAAQRPVGTGAEKPMAPNGENTAPNAPNVRAQFVKELGDAATVAGDPTTHDVLSNPELTQAGERLVANIPDEELLTKYSGVPDLAKAEDQATARAAVIRFVQLAKSGNPEVAAAANKALENIAEGSEKGISQGARTLNYFQDMLGSLPREARIPFLIKAIDKQLVKAGLSPLSDDPAMRSQVAATLDKLFGDSENIKSQMTSLEDKQKEAINNPKSSTPEETAQNAAQHQALMTKYAAQNGEIERYKASLLPPGKSPWEIPADLQRTSMLGGVGGRVKNIFNVGGSAIYDLVRSAPQALMAKIGNLLRDPGTYNDTTLFNKGLVTGAKSGLQESVAKFKGSELVKNSDFKVKSGSDPYELIKTADNKGLNKVRNVVQAGVQTASDVIGGAMKQAQVVRDATQMGKQLGYTGDDLKTYVNARSTLPTPKMEQASELLKKQVSHMNDNWISDVFNKLQPSKNASGPVKGIVGIIKNSILPFAKYPATFVYNGLADHNVLADVVHLTQAVNKGDTDGVFKAISGLAVNGTAMYAGYHFMTSGIITTKDASGYSDSGLYLHINNSVFGDRYIPLGLFGMAAIPLVAGAAMQQAFTKGGNPAANFMQTVGSTIMDTFEEGNAQSLVGGGNTVLSDVQKTMSGAPGAPSVGEDAAVAAGNTAGEFIPGVASDANSILNMTPLNPTGLPAQTKVISSGLTPTGRPSTAKDIVASELQSLKNRIPFESQSLPRDTTATNGATDVIDRVTGGDHATPDQTAVKAAALTQAQQTANQVTRDSNTLRQVGAFTPAMRSILDPAAQKIYDEVQGKGNVTEANLKTLTDAMTKGINETGDSRFLSNGDYKSNLTALQVKYNALQADPTTTQDTLDKYKAQIARGQVYETQKVPYSQIEAYQNTTNAEWKAMGDPTNSAYDPAAYQALYSLDQSLAQAGGSLASNDPTKSKYALPSTAKSGAASAQSAANREAKNVIHSLMSIKGVSLSKIAPKAAPGPAMPKIAITDPSQLIKKRSISVSAAKA